MSKYGLYFNMNGYSICFIFFYIKDKFDIWGVIVVYFSIFALKYELICFIFRSGSDLSISSLYWFWVEVCWGFRSSNLTKIIMMSLGCTYFSLFCQIWVGFHVDFKLNVWICVRPRSILQHMSSTNINS